MPGAVFMPVRCNGSRRHKRCDRAMIRSEKPGDRSDRGDDRHARSRYQQVPHRVVSHGRRLSVQLIFARLSRHVVGFTSHRRRYGGDGGDGDNAAPRNDDRDAPCVRRSHFRSSLYRPDSARGRAGENKSSGCQSTKDCLFHARLGEYGVAVIHRSEAKFALSCNKRSQSELADKAPIRNCKKRSNGLASVSAWRHTGCSRRRTSTRLSASFLPRDDGTAGR